MLFITALAGNDQYRTAPGLFSRVKGKLQYGEVYSAEPSGDWFYIPVLTGYAHKSVVRQVSNPTIPRPPALPTYLSQWYPEANSRQNDCGPACLAMHLRARGDTVTINQLRTVNATGLTDAPELQQIMQAHNVVTVIQRADPTVPLASVPRYSLLLINYGDLPRDQVQDTHFHDIRGWHWLIFWGIDETDPTKAIVLDPNYWGARINEGNMKRYPVAALRTAFRPYGNNKTTTALVFPDLQGSGVPAPVWSPRFIDSPFPLGLNVHSGPAIGTPLVGSGFANGTAINVDLTTLSGGYVREHSGGWVAIKYIADKPPALPAPGQQEIAFTTPLEKWGLHAHFNAPWFDLEEFMFRNKDKVAGICVINEVKTANKLAAAGFNVVFRVALPPAKTYQTAWLNGKTESEAKAIGRDFYLHGPERPWVEQLDKRVIVKLVNECGWHAMDYAFWLGVMEEAKREGRRLAIFGDSYGTPEVDQWVARIPALREAMASNYLVALNTYGIDNGEAYKYLGGRYILFLDAVPADCRPAIAFTETGVNDGTTTDPDAVPKTFTYTDRLARDKYAAHILMANAWTFGKWMECSLDSQLPRAEIELNARPNGVMTVYKPGSVPAPTPAPNPAPNPTPIPAPTGFNFPFPATVRGIHGNAGGWQPDQAELDTITRNKIELLYIATYEQNQAAVTVGRMRQAGVKYFVLRATHRGDWANFAIGSLPRLKEYAAAIGSTNNLAIQIHNEPNLAAEGLGSGWKDGAEFAVWWKRIADIYRRELPGCRVGFPALSPGGDIPGTRLAEITFARQAVSAIQAADWIGVHHYYLNTDIRPPVSTWHALYGNKPLLGTEVGPANEVPITNELARAAYTAFITAGVPMCAWLLNSPTNDFSGQSWVRQNITL
jgi:hypothetical protein